MADAFDFVRGGHLRAVAGAAHDLFQSRAVRTMPSDRLGDDSFGEAPSQSKRGTGGPHYRDARRYISERAWSRAKRALDEAARLEPESPAALDLVAVRTVRRSLEHLARWPSDVTARVALGTAYFELDLGEAALAEATRLQHLAPDRSEGFALAALEYLFRSDYPRAASSWQAARKRNSGLVPFDELAQIRSRV